MTRTLFMLAVVGMLVSLPWLVDESVEAVAAGQSASNLEGPAYRFEELADGVHFAIGTGARRADRERADRQADPVCLQLPLPFRPCTRKPAIWRRGRDHRSRLRPPDASEQRARAAYNPVVHGCDSRSDRSDETADCANLGRHRAAPARNRSADCRGPRRGPSRDRRDATQRDLQRHVDDSQGRFARSSSTSSGVDIPAGTR